MVRLDYENGVPKGTRTYVDAENPRKGADRGLSLPLADGGFNAEEGTRVATGHLNSAGCSSLP